MMVAQFLITTIAIIVGPILAVCAARYLEKNDRLHHRRLAVFRDLMATRITWYSQQHIGALNLIEVEYYGDDEVLQSYKDLMMLLSDKERFDQARNNDVKNIDLNQKVGDLYAILLNKMAKSLGYEMSDIALMRGGYYPELLTRFDEQKVRANEFVADLMDGKRHLPIAVIDYQTSDQIKAAIEAMTDKVNQSNG